MIKNNDKESPQLTSSVKETARFVSENSKYVKINTNNLKNYTTQKLSLDIESIYPKWSSCHYQLNNYPLELAIGYICVIDSLNFCFWPTLTQDPSYEFEYGDLVEGLNNLIETDKSFFTANNLCEMTPTLLKEKLFKNRPFPLLDERSRSLNEMGRLIMSKYKGSFVNLLEYNDYNLLSIMKSILDDVSTFRDITVYKGRQIFMYKRVQILAADLYSALTEWQEKKIKMTGVEHLTMFPDYRVPQILNELNILEYSDELKVRITNHSQLSVNSEEEIEIRANTIIAVEEMRRIAREEFGKDHLSIHIDYLLWNEGEVMRKDIVPHHRTLTIFY